MMISHRDGNDNEPKTINDKELWEACRIGDLSRVQDLLRKVLNQTITRKGDTLECNIWAVAL